MRRMDERERSLWIAALTRRIRRLAGPGSPGRRPAHRPGAPPKAPVPPTGAEEVR